MSKRFLTACLIGMMLFWPAAGQAAVPQDSRVVVYYFHTTSRCGPCAIIEKNTASALKSVFEEELMSGRLLYQPVNIDGRENRHFVEDYRLFTKSVVLSLVKDGKEVRFKNLDKIWLNLRNRQKFDTYIQEEAAIFLNEL